MATVDPEVVDNEATFSLNTSTARAMAATPVRDAEKGTNLGDKTKAAIVASPVLNPTHKSMAELTIGEVTETVFQLSEDQFVSELTAHGMRSPGIAVTAYKSLVQRHMCLLLEGQCDALKQLLNKSVRTALKQRAMAKEAQAELEHRLEEARASAEAKAKADEARIVALEATISRLVDLCGDANDEEKELRKELQAAKEEAAASRAAAELAQQKAAAARPVADAAGVNEAFRLFAETITQQQQELKDAQQALASVARIVASAQPTIGTTGAAAAAAAINTGNGAGDTAAAPSPPLPPETGANAVAPEEAGGDADNAADGRHVGLTSTATGDGLDEDEQDAPHPTWQLRDVCPVQ